MLPDASDVLEVAEPVAAAAVPPATSASAPAIPMVGTSGSPRTRARALTLRCRPGFACRPGSVADV